MPDHDAGKAGHAPGDQPNNRLQPHQPDIVWAIVDEARDERDAYADLAHAWELQARYYRAAFDRACEALVATLEPAQAVGSQPPGLQPPHGTGIQWQGAAPGTSATNGNVKAFPSRKQGVMP